MVSIRRPVSRVPKDHRRGAVMRERRAHRVQPSLVDLLSNRLAEDAGQGFIDEITRWFESAEAELERRPADGIH